uniref:RING-type domain-containing protein n=1 Tax=Populus trichocarpa TaxID=3694 RepID=A0A2K1Z0D7_POPTR
MAGVQGSQTLIPVNTSVISREPTGIESSLLASLLRKEGEGMEETKKAETHLTSAAAFMEGGVQEACDDACSICLENFRESDPSTACIVDINDLFI